jgi:esterase
MPARLHREVVAGDAPTRFLLMTHGIFGAGGNWRSIARQVVNKRPEWGAILVDLRGHGRSSDGDPPHDLAACAQDVIALVRDEAATGRDVRALCGHSFGGKVMLACRADWPADAPPLAQTWVLDSTPSRRPTAMTDPDNTVMQVLELLAGLPAQWRRRADFVEAVAKTRDGTTLANWLAMSLVPDGELLRLRLDVAMMRALLADYYARDLWPVVEDPAMPGDVRFVIAGTSDTVTIDDRARAQAAPRSTVDVLDTGHWLHLHAPAAVVELIAAGLP